MTLDDLRATLGDEQPPAGLSPLLRALWLDARGDWSGAHDLAQQVDERDGAWVHAYLHRKEGDTTNAAYWYRQAGRALVSISLDEEWALIAQTFLGG